MGLGCGWIYNESRGVGAGFVRVSHPSEFPSPDFIHRHASRYPRGRRKGFASRGGIQSPRDLYNGCAKPLGRARYPKGKIENNKRFGILEYRYTRQGIFSYSKCPTKVAALRTNESIANSLAHLDVVKRIMYFKKKVAVPFFQPAYRTKS